MAVTRDKNCFCHTCGRWFHYLGIARHRMTHYEKREPWKITYTNGNVGANRPFKKKINNFPLAFLGKCVILYLVRQVKNSGGKKMETKKLTANEYKALTIEQAADYVEQQLADDVSEYAAYSFAEGLYNLTEADIAAVANLIEYREKD